MKPSRKTLTLPKRVSRGVLSLLCATSCLGLLAPLPTLAESPGEYPYVRVGENPVLEISCESWVDLWKAMGAPDLGNQLLLSLRKDVVPALIKDSESPEEARKALDAWDEAVEEVDWEGLRNARIGLVVWTDLEDQLFITVAITPPSTLLEKTEEAVEQLLSSLAEGSEDFEWEDGEEGPRLIYVGSEEEVEGATGESEMTTAEEVEEEEEEDTSEQDGIYLEERSGTIWLTVDHPVEKSFVGPGLSELEGFSAAWNRLESPPLATVILNFEGVEKATLGALEKDLSESEGPSADSSLVFDETMEALFKDDPETLQKLKEVDAGLDFWTAHLEPSYEKGMRRLFSLLGDQGFWLSASMKTEGGFLSTSLQRPRPGSKGAGLFESTPLSDGWNGLMQPDLVSCSITCLPDLDLIYRTATEIVEALPEGETFLENWETIQEAFGLNVEKNLIPAIGRQMALLSRKTDKPSMPGMMLSTNETYVLIDSPDAQATRDLMDRVAAMLRDSGLATSSVLIGGASFTRVDTGFVGTAEWTVLDDPAMLVFAKGTDEAYVTELLAALRDPSAKPLLEHPRWKELKEIWVDSPHGISLDDVDVTLRQSVEQLKTSRMMAAMMGGGSAVPMSLIGLAIQAIEGLPSPDTMLEVSSVEGEFRITKTLVLYQEDHEKGLPNQ